MKKPIDSIRANGPLKDDKQVPKWAGTRINQPVNTERQQQSTDQEADKSDQAPPAKSQAAAAFCGPIKPLSASEE